MNGSQISERQEPIKFTLSRKFIVIAVLYFLPLIYAGYAMLTEHTEIQFSKMELKGNKYQQALKNLLEDVPQSMILNQQYLLGDTTLKGQLSSEQAKIDHDFHQLIITDEELGSDLATSEKDFFQRSKKNVNPSALRRQWESLKQQMFTLDAKTNLDLHALLIADIGRLIDHIGDTSQLILDPDLDTYYLMDSSLLKLPSAQKIIPSILTYSEEIIKNKAFTDENKANLIVQIGLLQNSITGTHNGIQKAYISDKLAGDMVTQQALEESLRTYEDIVNSFISYVQDKFINAKDPPISSAEIASLANHALAESFRFWDIVVEQLNRLLAKRVNYYRTQQIMLIVIILIIPFFVIYMRRITKPINTLIAATQHFAQGDRTARVDKNIKGDIGEVAVSFNTMADFLQEVILQMKKSGMHLTSASTEIAAASKEQEATVSEQEATAREISATAQGIYESAKTLAETMGEVNKTSEETSSLAISGKEGLSQMNTIMQQMVDASNNISSKLAILNEKAGNITGVITTITKVADQTNLLSLNAAIEAEKAGEHGRSFAVIAREIRRLADQTAYATLDIKKMVNEIGAAVSSGVMGVDRFSEEIRVGVNQVKLVGDQLSKIIDQVEDQTTSIETVNEGMQRQTQSAHQITAAISQLSNVTQQTAHAIRRFHGTIAQMNASTNDLQNTVDSISA